MQHGDRSSLRTQLSINAESQANSNYSSYRRKEKLLIQILISRAMQKRELRLAVTSPPLNLTQRDTLFASKIAVVLLLNSLHRTTVENEIFMLD